MPNVDYTFTQNYPEGNSHCSYCGDLVVYMDRMYCCYACDLYYHNSCTEVHWSTACVRYVSRSGAVEITPASDIQLCDGCVHTEL